MTETFFFKHEIYSQCSPAITYAPVHERLLHTHLEIVILLEHVSLKLTKFGHRLISTILLMSEFWPIRNG